MITGGVDLASQDPKTALCVITWSEEEATVDELKLGVDDGAIAALLRGADKVGLDVPLGWPISFARAVGASLDGSWPESYLHAQNIDYRLRRTDRWLWRTLKTSPPLSVSTDRIALPAMRAAALLSRQRTPVPRDGSATVVEVYPAAALRRWGFTSRQYKGGENDASRTTLVTTLLYEARAWLRVSPKDVALCRTSDDAFDALVCALVARAAAISLVEEIPPEEHWAALSEGWIALPLEGSFGRLSHREGTTAPR